MSEGINLWGQKMTEDSQDFTGGEMIGRGFGYT
jgi:hypothetical protein